MFDGVLVIVQRAVSDDLQVVETTAVVDFDEAESTLGIATRTDPAFNAYLTGSFRTPARLEYVADADDDPLTPGAIGLDRARRQESGVPRLPVGLVKQLAKHLYANSQLRMAA